ncbi:MAG: hypothetical protein HWD84_07530 [Flavobacteriaceae bacterium]|nr:hypothetical protein [Flavobacteriaceae bacterium]
MKLLKNCLFLLMISFAAQADEVITRVIDTHAGHASVTKFSDGSIMVYDAGRYSYADHIVKQVETFATDGVVDLLVLSHTDGDHVGAVPELFAKFDIKKVIRLGYVRCEDRPQSRRSCPWYFANEAIDKAEIEGKTVDINLTETEESIVGNQYSFGETTLSILSAFNIPPESWGLTTGGSEWLKATCRS